MCQVKYPKEGPRKLNWFSLSNALQIYSHFCHLDEDHSGMLKKEEFMKYMILFTFYLCPATWCNIIIIFHSRYNLRIGKYDDDKNSIKCRLTSTFVDKYFGEVETFVNDVSQENEIDFRTFVDFVLAYTYMNEPQSISYFLRLLDCKKKGSLDEFDIFFFYKVYSVELNIIIIPNGNQSVYNTYFRIL